MTRYNAAVLPGPGPQVLLVPHVLAGVGPALPGARADGLPQGIHCQVSALDFRAVNGTSPILILYCESAFNKEKALVGALDNVQFRKVPLINMYKTP